MSVIIHYNTTSARSGRTSTLISTSVLDLAERLWGRSARHRLAIMAEQLRETCQGRVSRAVEAAVITEAAARLP